MDASMRVFVLWHYGGMGVYEVCFSFLLGFFFCLFFCMRWFHYIKLALCPRRLTSVRSYVEDWPEW